MDIDANRLAALDDAMDWPGVVGWIQNSWAHEYGFFDMSETKPGIYDLRLSTGGWSENEEIVSVLNNTMFWFLFWQESRRGGHYRFEIERELFMKEGSSDEIR